MKTKKLFALVLAVIMMFSMTACLQNNAPAPSADGAPTLTSTTPVNIIWPHNAVIGSVSGKQGIKFKEEIEGCLNGLITAIIYQNGGPGSVPENDQTLHEGSIQLNSGIFGGLVDTRLSYFDAPNLVSSNE